VIWLFLLAGLAGLAGALWVRRRAASAEPSSALPERPRELHVGAATYRPSTRVAVVHRNARATVLPFARVLWDCDAAGADVPSFVEIDAPSGRMALCCVDRASPLVVDLTGLLRVMPFVYNELGLARLESLLAEAEVHAIGDVLAFVLGLGIPAQNLAYPASWLEADTANAARPAAVHAPSERIALRMRWPSATLTLFAARTTFEARVRAGHDEDAPARRARRMGLEPWLDIATPAAFVACVESDGAPPRFYAGDAGPAEIHAAVREGGAASTERDAALDALLASARRGTPPAV
jgi:hypothetical protein